jgi:uncharacterized protein
LSSSIGEGGAALAGPITKATARRSNWPLVFFAGASIGVLGGLIGLGGAEFRLPLLIEVFGFVALEAVILNKATSLVVVTAALPFRMASVPFDAIIDRWDVLLTRSAEAWLGRGSGRAGLLGCAPQRSTACWRYSSSGSRECCSSAMACTALASRCFTAGCLCSSAPSPGLESAGLRRSWASRAGSFSFRTIVLLFGMDVKLAGSLSLAVSLPTMIVGFARYSQDQSFAVIRAQSPFLAVMAARSIVGAFVDGRLLGAVPDGLLLPLLAAILLISAVKVWRHS